MAAALWRILPAILVCSSALLGACGDAGPLVLDLAFDGESCTYDGPTDLAPGPVELVFVNSSDAAAAVSFEVFVRNKTIQDTIDYIGEEPSPRHGPYWALNLGTWEPVSAGDTYRWEGNLAAGTYTLVCARWAPHGAFFGAGLTVVE